MANKTSLEKDILDGIENEYGKQYEKLIRYSWFPIMISRNKLIWKINNNTFKNSRLTKNIR